MDYKGTCSRRKNFNIFKTVYLSLIITVASSILEEIRKIQETFLWYSSKPKINHKRLCNTFEDGGFKNVDVKKKKKIVYNVLGLKSYMTVTIMTGKLYHYIFELNH